MGYVLLYFELAANAILVWSEFAYGHPAMGVAGRVACGLGYAFAPFLVALLSAWLLTNKTTTRKVFLTNLEITWCLTLFVAGLTLISSLGL